jgi:hypothetical protein
MSCIAQEVREHGSVSESETCIGVSQIATSLTTSDSRFVCNADSPLPCVLCSEWGGR